MNYQFWKNILDVTFAAFLLIIFSPLMVFLSLLIFLFLGKPVFFIQTRVGKNEKQFKIYKYRTMVNNAEALGGGYSKSELIPPLGKLLRASSLDELPQLFNILRGDMSFVGPRPTIPSQVERYTPEQRKRHQIKPGLTGKAQIKYRNNAPWSLRIIEDNIYIDDLSLINDLSIVMQTIAKIFAFSSVALDQSPNEIDDLGTKDSDAKNV